MDWMVKIEAGIREALTKYPIHDYWIVVNDKAQEVWGRQKAHEIVSESNFGNDKLAESLVFRVVTNKTDRKKWPIGSLINF